MRIKTQKLKELPGWAKLSPVFLVIAAVAIVGLVYLAQPSSNNDKQSHKLVAIKTTSNNSTPASSTATAKKVSATVPPPLPSTAPAPTADQEGCTSLNNTETTFLKAQLSKITTYRNGSLAQLKQYLSGLTDNPPNQSEINQYNALVAVYNSDINTQNQATTQNYLSYVKGYGLTANGWCWANDQKDLITYSQMQSYIVATIPNYGG